MSIEHWLIIGAGGFCGAVMRAFIVVLVEKIAWPYFLATSLVNVLGSFCMGLFLAYFGQKSGFNELGRFFWITGFCGALTTFSTLTYDNFLFLEKGDFLLFFLHIFSNITLCLLAMYGALSLMRSTLN